MKPQTMLTRGLIALSVSLTSTLCLAHEGHGMPGQSHWHDTDAWGFVAIGALAMAGYSWFKGGRK